MVRSDRAARAGIELILRSVVHPAIRLDDGGKISWWNGAAGERFAWLTHGEPIASVAPDETVARVLAALASPADDVMLDGFGARLIRLGKDHRLLLFDAPETEVFHKYRTLVDNLPVVLWTVHQDGYVFVSPNADRVSGYTSEEILQPDFRTVWAGSVHPDDLGRALAAYQALFRDGAPFEVEYRFRRKDGVWRWLFDHAVHTYEQDARILASGVSQDITERKRAESQQLALAGFGRRALTSTDEQMLMTDACRTVVEVLEVSKANTLMFDAAEDAFTFPTQALMGGVPIVYGNLQEETRFATDELLSTGTRAGIAAPIFGRAARYGVLHAQTSEPRAFSEREAAFVQSMANILAEAIERNRAERELERQKAQLSDAQRRLQVIVSRLPVMLFSTDMELRLTSVTGEGFAPMPNSMLCDLTLADLIGPDPNEGGCRVALTGREATYDTWHGDRDLRVHIEPLTDDDTGAPIGVVGMAFDVTDEKRAEEANQVLLERLHDAAAQWRDTFDSILAPMFILDDELRVRRMNAAALRFSRFTDYLDALEQPLTSFGDAPIWSEIHTLARKARRQKRSAAVQHGDREGRVWDLFASSGQRQTVIIVSEVTEVVRMQRNLRRAEVMSEMGALVAGVAHEVRNPLFGLSATLDAFEEKFGTAQFQDYVSALREQIDRMSQLMHELLEYGRPVASELRRYDPAPVLRRAIDSMEPLARQSGVSVHFRIPNLLHPVRMDRQRLLQVFENLLKNAIQHSVNGTDVEVLAATADDGKTIAIEVADRGAGFAPEDLERVFEPFFTRRRGGTGLGLSLARRIVDEHHGAIRASNREGGGASMVVTLPIAETGRLA